MEDVAKRLPFLIYADKVLMFIILDSKHMD